MPILVIEAATDLELLTGYSLGIYCYLITVVSLT